LVIFEDDKYDKTKNIKNLINQTRQYIFKISECWVLEYQFNSLQGHLGYLDFLLGNNNPGSCRRENMPHHH
jgi:hypothetical protein